MYFFFGGPFFVFTCSTVTVFFSFSFVHFFLFFVLSVHLSSLFAFLSIPVLYVHKSFAYNHIDRTWKLFVFAPFFTRLPLWWYVSIQLTVVDENEKHEIKKLHGRWLYQCVQCETTALQPNYIYAKQQKYYLAQKKRRKNRLTHTLSMSFWFSVVDARKLRTPLNT